MSAPRGTADHISIPLIDLNRAGVTGATLVTTISKDGGAFVATTNSVTEPAGSMGSYDLLLTSAERDCTKLEVQATDGVIGTKIICYPSSDVAPVASVNTGQLATELGPLIPAPEVTVDIDEATLANDLAPLLPAGITLNEVVPGAYASGTAGHVLGHLAEATVIHASPVATGPVISIYRGFDYGIAAGTALDFDSNGLWPDLTGSTVMVKIAGVDYAAVAVSATKVRLELTAVQTQAMNFSTSGAIGHATLQGGQKVVLFDGMIKLKEAR